MVQEKNISGFTWDAADYAKSSPAQKCWAHELVQKIDLSGHERVLDIGCGDGKVSAEIARCLPAGSVTGLDRSPGMIRFAREAFPENSYPNLHVRRGRRSGPALRKCVRCCLFERSSPLGVRPAPGPCRDLSGRFRSGGRMVVQMGGKGNAAGIFVVLDRMLAEPAWARYFAGFSFRYGFFSPENTGRGF